MKTKKEKQFNWLTFLRKAVRHPRSITEEEWADARRRSGNWPTCACGEQCKALPRETGWKDAFGNDTLGPESPKDKILGLLGMDFYHAVGMQRPNHALLIFQQIELRSIQLLRELRGEDRR